MRRGLLAMALLLVTGCSLPLPRDVHAVGEAPAEQRQAGPLQVIPPGPKPGATPVETVQAFLGAQASSDGRHAIAREFLTAAERTGWNDDVDVQVYDPDTIRFELLPDPASSAAVVRVVSRVSARVRPDGSYVVRPDVTVTELYSLVRVGGQWRLSEVPEGLRLTAADRQRAFAPRPVYYLAPAVGDEQPRLVPDLVFLPVAPDLARALVSRLLRAPSLGLAGSVGTAVPTGTRVRRVDQSSSGLVTVDLVGAATRPTGRAAEDLSAQLVWTLRSLGTSFHGLRLRFDGRPLAVPGEGDVQGAGDWDSYDPQGLGPTPPYFFVSGRRLRASVELPPNPATAGDVGDGRAVAVDEVAVTPDRTRVALVEHAGADSTVRVGPLRGSSFPVVARGTRLSSPSWGAGDRGLWLLRDGRDVVRVDGGLHPVTVLGLPSGRLTGLAVSRDGVRIALVAGGHLYVGRVEIVGGTPRVVGLNPVLPQLHAATEVSWASGTEVVALGVLTRSRQAVRVSVDGSAVQILNTAGLAPTELAASPAGVVLVSSGRLFLSTGGTFQQVQTDTASGPAFPG